MLFRSIPWNGPIAGISVGLVDGEIVLNPTLEQRAHNDLRLTVAGTMEKIVMIEAGANEIPEQQMLDAILAGHAEIKKMVAFINDIKNEIGKPKFEFQSMELDHDLFAAIEAMVGEQVKVALDTNDKNERTKMDIGTTHILAIVNGYNGKEGLKETAEMIQSLLRDYAGSDGGELIYFE